MHGGSGVSVQKETDVSQSPAVSRRRLGSELRRLRDAAGKRIEDAALALECSPAKVSRLENGKGVPRTRDVRDLAALYGIDGRAKREELLDLAVQGQGQDWWSDFRDVVHGEMFADHLLQYIALERDASTIKTFHPDLVPGLLQTEEYIAAYCSLLYPEQSQRERDRFVDFRKKRQDVVWQAARPPRVSVILSEAVLIRPLGGRAVLRRQLEALRAGLGGSRTLDLRITPLSTASRGAIGGPFTIVKFAEDSDQDVVYLEGREDATYLEADADVKRYERSFRLLAQESLTRDESVKRLTDEIELLDDRAEAAPAAR